MLHFLIVAVYQNFHGFSQHGGVIIIHDAGLNHLDNLSPFLGNLCVRILHLGGRGSLFRGKGKGTDPFQPQLPQELTELLELLLTLTGKTGNDAGADYQSGNPAAELGEQTAQKFSVSPTVHQLQNLAVAVLNGNVQILDNFRLLCHDIHQLIVNFIRIDIVHTDPFQLFDLTQLPQKLRQQALVPRQIRSVTAGILRHNNQFFYTACSQHPSLIQNIVQLAAPEPSPKIGNNAVGTAVIAPFRNFNIGIVLRCGDDTAGFLFGGINGTKIRN